MRDESSAPPEEWRPVVGWERLFWVSNLGRLRSRFRVRKLPRYRAPRPIGIGLTGPGRKRTPVTIHSLVAAAFLGPCPPGKEIDHVNGYRGDNRAANLEYVPHKVNVQRAHRLGLIRPENYATKLTAELAAEIRGLRPTLTIDEIADRYGVSRAMVSLVTNGRTWRHANGPTANRRLKRASGERHGKTTLTVEQVRDIRRRAIVPNGRGSQGNLSALAREYGVGSNTISAIVSRTTWKHLD